MVITQMFLCVNYQINNTNRIIQRKLPLKNTQKLAVLPVTKLSTKSSYKTAKDSYKHPQHTSKHSSEKPHPNTI